MMVGVLLASTMGLTGIASQLALGPRMHADVVVLDQAVEHAHGDVGLAFGVVEDQFDLAPPDAALAR